MDRDFVDYYKTLGVKPNLPSGLPKDQDELSIELKSAFRKLQKEIHSDLKPDATAEDIATRNEMGKEVNAAWHKLKDPKDRSVYYSEWKTYYSRPESVRRENERRVQEARDSRLKDAIARETIRQEQIKDERAKQEAKIQAEKEAAEERERQAERDRDKGRRRAMGEDVEDEEGEETAAAGDPTTDGTPPGDEGGGETGPEGGPTEKERAAAEETRRKAREAADEARRRAQQEAEEERLRQEAREAAERKVREAEERARLKAEAVKKVTDSLREFRRLEDKSETFRLHAEIATELLGRAAAKTAEAEAKKTTAEAEKTAAAEKERLAGEAIEKIRKTFENVEKAEKEKSEAERARAKAQEDLLKAENDADELKAAKKFEDAGSRITKAEVDFNKAIGVVAAAGVTGESVRNANAELAARQEELRLATEKEAEAKRKIEDAKRKEDKLAQEAEIAEQVQLRTARDSEIARQKADKDKREATEGITDEKTKKAIKDALDEVIRVDIAENEIRLTARETERSRIRKERLTDTGVKDKEGTEDATADFGDFLGDSPAPGGEHWARRAGRLVGDVIRTAKENQNPTPYDSTEQIRSEAAEAKAVKERMRNGPGGEEGA